MNRAQRLESILRAHGNSATLSQIIKSTELRATHNTSQEDSEGWMGLRHRFSAAVSELRADLEGRTPMETLVWMKGKTPGVGIYAIVSAVVKDGVVVVSPRQLTIHECRCDDESLISKLEMGGVDE